MTKPKSTKGSCYNHWRDQLSPARACALLPAVFVLLLLSGFNAANAQKDSVAPSGARQDHVTDSSDYYLSTDTNTHDISVALNNGYVAGEQEQRHIPPSKIRAYKNQEAFAYANDPAYWQQEKPKDLHLDIYWRFLEIVCGAFLIYGIYRLGKENFSGLFFRKANKSKGDPDLETDDELLSADDLEKRLAAARSAGDFRGAVRLMYLKLLKNLQERQLIPVGRLATNRAWASVFADPGKAGQFRSLARAYEYVTYGGFELTETQFGVLEEQFSDFTNKLPG